ncbi:hypothetical protein GLYMA_12G143650v4 [Glycine max]|nr:hypothetical protein GLYMA_12G143650v4 [Glycine max]KAH1143154.1 hypothetical protein GYH30_033726 [Glycine max]
MLLYIVGLLTFCKITISARNWSMLTSLYRLTLHQSQLLIQNCTKKGSGILWVEYSLKTGNSK